MGCREKEVCGGRCFLSCHEWALYPMMRLLHGNVKKLCTHVLTCIVLRPDTASSAPAAGWNACGVSGNAQPMLCKRHVLDIVTCVIYVTCIIAWHWQA
jgi:hypothetical protein